MKTWPLPEAEKKLGSSPEGLTQAEAQKRLVEHVLPLLEQNKVPAYFNGHDHDLQHLQAGRVNLFCSGAGSKPRATKSTPHTKFAKGGCSGFVAASLQPDKLDVRKIGDRGNLLYTAAVPRAA